MMKSSEQIFKKGQQTEIVSEKPRIELTEEEVQNKLSRLGDITYEWAYELTKKLERPFDLKTIIVLARLVIKLERDLPTYDTILSDDASGRLPSLFLRKIINHVRSKTGQGAVKTYFLASGSHNKIEKDEAIERFLVDKKKEITKALVVTEYITTGNTIMNIMKLLTDIGIDFDVACVSAEEGPGHYIREFGDIFKKIRCGESFSTAGLSFFSERDIVGGVEKKDGSLSPHPEIVTPTDRTRLIRAREDANFLANEFINKLLD